MLYFLLLLPLRQEAQVVENTMSCPCFLELLSCRIEESSRHAMRLEVQPSHESRQAIYRVRFHSNNLSNEVYLLDQNFIFDNV